MKTIKKLMVVVLSLLFIASLTACGSFDSGGSEGGVKTWKVGHVRPAGTSTDEDLNWFSEKIKEKSNDTITIEVYPASQLGDYQVVQERVSMGDIEMQLAPVGNSINKNMELVNMPYLVTTWKQALDVYGPESDLMKAVDEMFAEQGIKLLAPYPKYFGGIALKKMPEAPTDPTVEKNTKIRVPGMKSYELNAQALGYSATPLPYSEAFTSMQTGIVDGVIGSGAEGYYSSFRDLTKYYLPLKDHFEVWYLYMSKSVWDKLSEEEQTFIQETAKELAEQRFEEAKQEEEDYTNKLRAEGIEVIEFTDEDINSFKEHVRKNVWPELKKQFDADLFETITESVN